MMRFFSQIVEWFIPPGLAESSPERARRCRMAISITLLCLPLNPIALFTYRSIGFDSLLLPVAYHGLVMGLCPLLIRFTGSPRIGGTTALINMLAAVTFVTLMTGGISSPVLWWVAPTSVIAGTIVGYWDAVVWAGISVLVVGVVAIFYPEGIASGLTITPLAGHTLTISTLLAVVVTLLGSFMYFEQSRVQSIERLERANITHRQARDEARQSLQVVAAEKKRTEEALTQVRASEEQLSESNRIKSELLRMAAHDLRGPLSEIIGLGTLALDQKSSSTPTSGDFVTMMMDSAQGMCELLDGLLDLNRIETGQLQPDYAQIDPRDMVASIIQDFEARAHHKNITIDTDVPSVQKTIYTDPLMLQQVLQNLVSNAIKYSPVESTVTLVVSKAVQSIHFSVIDEGPGLSEKDKANLYKPFSRLTPKPTGGETSTGVGLSIVKSLAETLGGDIHCKSAPGEGSTFTLELPLRSHKASAAA